MKAYFIYFLGLICCTATYSQGVNLKNGNCYISFSDVDFSRYNGIKSDFLTRTYNSKSTQKGWFGFGWGSKLETKLYFYPDYSVMIQEHGAGGKSVFTTALQDDLLTDELIETLIDVELENGILEDLPLAISKKRNKYKNSVELRLAVFNKYVKEGYLDHFQEFPENLTWQTFARGSDKALVFKDGNFIRSSRNGEKEYFNTAGNLTKIVDKNGNSLQIEYDGDSPKKIYSLNEFDVLLETNEDNQITRIKTSDGQEARLKYQEENLIWCKDSDGIENGFQYDESHNLTAIIYNTDRDKDEKIDGVLLEYTPKSKYISKITKRDGTVTEYKYKNFYTADGSKDMDHYATTVVKKGWNGKPVENYYEYLIGVGPNGDRYTKKIITRINGIETATTYHEKCVSPTRIERGERWATMKFDKNCNMIEKKRSNGDHIVLKYHPELKKVTRVEQNGTVNKFEYNKKGDVTLAQKNEEDPIILNYNEEGKVTELVNGEKILEFTYNDFGKPTRIYQSDLGEIIVTYDDNGDIKKVSNPDGDSSIALQITQSFQKLLSLTKVPNVDYNL